MRLILTLALFLSFLPTTSFGQTQTARACDIKKEHGFNTFSVKFTPEIWTSFPRLAEDAEIQKCEEWKGFPGLFILKISTGIQGTTKPRNEVDLIIVDTRSGKAVTKHKSVIEIHRGQEVEKIPHSFSSSKDGKTAILKIGKKKPKTKKF